MNTPNKTAAPILVILAFAIVYIVWGSTYFFIQQAIVDFPPFLLGAVRFVIAGLLMLGWSAMKGEKLWVKGDLKHSVISGLLMLFVGTGAVIWVEQSLPSAMVAIMVSSGPLWFILLDKPKWKENFTTRSTIYGLIIGFAGVILLFSENIVKAFSLKETPAELGSFAIMILGTIGWAAGSLYSKYKATRMSVSVSTGWQMLAAGIAFIPGSLLRGELTNLQWQNISTSSWLSVAYLIVFGSIAGFSAYVWLLKVRSATQVSTHAYVNPVVAVLLGVLFAGENISGWQVGGLLVILLSVLLINMVKYRKAKTGTEAVAEVVSEPVVVKSAGVRIAGKSPSGLPQKIEE
ncbi:MAG: EamA family transporter [Ferruginibacter sp.]|nr:EamA family transporter [Ferruginibacter sp.]